MKRPDSNSLRVAQLGVIWLLLLVGMYVALTFRPSSVAYIDYVDGYYLYVAHRMAAGVALYSGIMGVQPPGIFVVGDLVFRSWDSLTAVRTFGIIVHILTLILVYLTARRLYGIGARVVAATAFYAFAPYGLYWSRIFDPNPLVTLLSLLSVYVLLRNSRSAPVLAGIVGALALGTKIWYVPVGIAIVLFLYRHRREALLPFLIALLATLAVVCFAGVLTVGSSFWGGLVAQDVSGFSNAWFEASVVHVLVDDWPLVILALFGARTVSRWPGVESRLVLYYAISACTVLLATIKSGTAWPVFQFAEPALALLAPAALFPLAAKTARERDVSLSATTSSVSSRRLFSVAAIILVALSGISSVRSGQTWDDASVRNVVALIEAHSAANQTVLAPPYYLYLSGRRAVGEYADINIWALRADRGDARALQLVNATVQALRAKTIP
ncbi:MAG: hypothetical protein JWO42_869, partial [Chloroflexi bacterium]|nr:hypothetical protein [Chloroflexota bacterium]